MNDSQENKLSMYYKIRAFFETNLDTISPDLPILVGEKEKFNELIAELESHLTEASENISGYAEQKQMYRENLRQKMLELSGALNAFLILEGDRTSANKVYMTKSDFDRKRDGEIHFIYDKIFSVATARIAELTPFGFDATRLAQVTAAFNLFKSTIGQPGDERSQNASRLRMAVEHFNLIDESLEVIDSLMLSVSELHQALFIQYTFDRNIDDTGDNSPIPPDYEVSIPAGALVIVAELPYSAGRSFRAKNLSNDDVAWGISTLNTEFTTPPQPLYGKSTSNKLSSTLGPDGNFLLFQNNSPNPVSIEVTVIE